MLTRSANTGSTAWMSPGHPAALYAHGMGATLLVISGFLWLGWGYAKVARFMPVLWLVLYAAAATLLMLAVRVLHRGNVRLRAASPASGAMGWRRNGGAFRRVLKAEAIGCGLVVLLCAATFRFDLLAAGIALVVGLHFLPLARLFQLPVYYGTGIAIMAVAVFGVVHFAGPAATVAVGLGTGTILWITAICLLLRSRRSIARAGTVELSSNGAR